MLDQKHQMKVLQVGNKKYYVPCLQLGQSNSQCKTTQETLQITKCLQNKDQETDLDEIKCDDNSKERALIDEAIQKNNFEKNQIKRKLKYVYEKIDEKNLEENQTDEYVLKETIKPNQDIKFTHFISIPIEQTTTLTNKLNLFKQFCLQENSSLEYYFYNFQLHITIAVISITYDQELLLNMILEGLQEQIRQCFQLPSQNKQNIKLLNWFELKGIGVFGNPKECSVLFGKINQNDFIERLNNLSHLIISNLINTGIVQNMEQIPHVWYDKKREMYRVDKFHITLLKRGYQQEPMDCQRMLDKYQEFYFGKAEFNSVSLKLLDKNQTEIFSVKI